ncbi:MAG: hypothetical protein NWP79_10140, partial [Paracoccaceae bacterium]|nr:hypothetical protein [Paracoccaceae bacterium]
DVVEADDGKVARHRQPEHGQDFSSGAMIEGIVWCLQTPPEFVVIAAFVALTWALQRSWKVCLLVFACLLFVLNQGYWDETTDSLALVLSSCVVCMGLGVPIGIFLAHRPRAQAMPRDRRHCRGTSSPSSPAALTAAASLPCLVFST